MASILPHSEEYLAEFVQTRSLLTLQQGPAVWYGSQGTAASLVFQLALISVLTLWVEKSK